MDKLDIKKICCRQIFLSHIELIDVITTQQLNIEGLFTQYLTYLGVLNVIDPKSLVKFLSSLKSVVTKMKIRDIIDVEGNKTGEEPDWMGVTEGNLISPMLKAIQELEARIAVLENE